MAGGAALITGVGGAVGAGAATLGGKTTGFTAARVAADAIRLHVVTQLVFRDVDGNEEAAKAVIVSLRERVANLGSTVATLAERVEKLRAQLETKQAQVDAERTQRLEAEDRAARFRAVAGRLKERVTGLTTRSSRRCSRSLRNSRARRTPSRPSPTESPSWLTTSRKRRDRCRE
jgi:chromosome segregation ATPase